jgi:hypothetical protein
MNKILSKQGLRTATPADVQRIINMDENFLKGVYTDLGIVLRSIENPNKYLAAQLAEQSIRRNYKYSNSNPLVFKPSDLELILDSNSPSGLGFNISEQSTPFNAPKLSNKNHGKKFNLTNYTGMPVFDKDGTRTNYTNDNGLHRLYLGRCLDLGSGGGNLVYSDGYGRVVVLSDAEGVAPKFFEDYINNLEKEKQAQIEKIELNYQKALKVLKA